jgi:hypothetical protein
MGTINDAGQHLTVDTLEQRNLGEMMAEIPWSPAQ